MHAESCAPKQGRLDGIRVSVGNQAEFPAKIQTVLDKSVDVRYLAWLEGTWDPRVINGK